MARSVNITTPIPTLEEFGKSLGLSKRRQDSLLRLVKRDSTSGRFLNGRHKDTSETSGVIRERANADFRAKKV
jgi:hypothetical protein